MSPVKKQKKAAFEKYNDNRGIVLKDSGKQKLIDQFFPLDTDIVEDNSNDPIVVLAIINTFLVKKNCSTMRALWKC